METFRKRLILSLILNILMIVLFISSIINEIVEIYINPDSTYQTVWGLFRFLLLMEIYYLVFLIALSFSNKLNL